MGGYFSEEYMQRPEEPEAVLPQPQSRQQQVATIYHQNQEQFKVQQQEMQTREEDLNTAQYMTKLLDPAVPKAARQFLFRELSTRMGVDPKGDTSQNVGKMLLGLEPEALEQLNRGFAEKIKGASPGQIKQMTQAVLQGDVSGIELMKMAQARIGPPAALKNLSGKPPSPSLGSDTGDPASSPPAAVAPATGTTPPAVASPAAGGPPAPSTHRYKGQGETLPIHQPVEPGLVRALGLQFDKPVRASDLAKMGITVPTDRKEQQELSKQMDANAATTVNLMRNSTKLHQLFNGKPEVLGVIGATARTVDQAVDQVKGLARVAGLDTSGVDASDRGFRAMAAGVANRISAAYKAAGIEQTAIDSSRLQGAVIEMAYSMAAAQGIPGNRITNAILNQNMAVLGQSQSEAQFEATLKDQVTRALAKSNAEISSRVGTPLTPNLGHATPGDLQIMFNSGIITPELRKVVGDEAKKRLEGTGGRPVTRQDPTIEKEQSYISEQERLDEQRKRHEENRSRQKMDLELRRDKRAETGELRAEERAQRQEFESNRRFNLAEKREKRMEEQHRRDKIGAAFMALGKAIGDSSGRQISVGGGGGGGDQDASAFRMAPPQRRTPPKPVDAERYQRKPGK